MSRRPPLEPSPRRPSGFTVLELVAALAATGLIVALGVSAYRTYSVRREIAAMVARAEPLRQQVAAAFGRSGVPPRDAAEAGLADDPRSLGRYVESVSISDGRIDVRYAAAADPALAGQTLSLTPFESASREVVWVCGNRLPGPGLEPLGFAGGLRQAVQVLTTINARYLPPLCR